MESGSTGVDSGAEVRPIIARLFTVALLTLAVWDVSALASPPYPLLVNAHGLRVYGPPARPNVCPHVLALPPKALSTARRAVALAMPRYEARLKLNGHDSVVSIRASAKSGFTATAGGCGRLTWHRSVVAFVRLPHVRTASLSQHTFAVGRIRSGWVLWATIH